MNVLEVAPPAAGAAGAEVVADLGTGTPVVVLHGVGFGPSSLTPLATAVAGSARVLVVRRPAAVPGVPLDVQARSVADVVATRLGHRPYVVAGVSGGASLALALATRRSAPVAAVVAHEPLLGRHAPALRRAVAASHERLAAGDLDPAGWFAGLVGDEAWAGLDPEVRAAAIDLHPDLAAEVAPFASWHPSSADLRSLASRSVVTTVGAESAAVRHQAAAILHRASGATVVAVPGAGHLVQLDAPEAFARIVLRAAGAS